MPTLDEARAQFAVDATARLQAARLQNPAPVILVRAPAGLGKTRMVAHLLRGNRVVWFAPRNELMQELARAHQDPLPDIVPLVPGRPPPTLEKRPARADQDQDGRYVWCAEFSTRIAPVRALGLGRFERRQACVWCSKRRGCPYPRWQPRTQWLFLPHVWLDLPLDRPDVFTGCEFVVIDESPLTHVLHATVLKPHEIVLLRDALTQVPRKTFLAFRALRDLLTVCSDLLASPPPRRRIVLRDLLADLGYRFTQNIDDGTRVVRMLLQSISGSRRVLTKRFRVSPPPTESDLAEADATSLRLDLPDLKAPPYLVEKLIGLFDAVAEDVRERPTCVLKLPEDGSQGAIIAGRVHQPPIPKHLPIVVLDSTGFTTNYRALFPGRPVVEQTTEVTRQVQVLQMGDHRWPLQTLRTSPAALDKAMEMVDRYKSEHPAHRVGLILAQTLLGEPRIKEAVDQRFQSGDVGFFWATRGANDFEHHDAVFVLGAPEVPPDELEGQARALQSLDPVQPGEKPGDWRVRSRVLEDGTDDRGYGYGNAADFLYWELHQSEYTQAVGRVRPYVDRPTSDGQGRRTVFFLSNVGLFDITTNLTTEAELRGRVPDLLLRVRDELKKKRAQGRVGPISQQELAGEVGVSPAALSQALKRAGGSPIVVEIQALLRD